MFQYSSATEDGTKERVHTLRMLQASHYDRISLVRYAQLLLAKCGKLTARVEVADFACREADGAGLSS